MPPTGQAEAHAGSWQWKHSRRTNLSPRGSTTVSAVAESVGSCSGGKLCAALHACSQAWQPTHLVMSISIALDWLSMSRLRLCLQVHLGAPPERSEGWA